AWLLSLYRKALMTLRGDVVADMPVGPDSADIGHEYPGFAGHVGAHVPGVGLRIERGVGDLVDRGHPIVLGVLLRFHGVEIAVAHIGDAVADPVDMLLDRDDHVPHTRRTAGPGHVKEAGESQDN